MRALRVSVRILRLPRNSMRSMMACGWALAACGATCWVASCSAVVTDSALGESEGRDNHPESTDADGPARRFFCVVAGELDARDKKNAAIQATRNAKTPNGKQTLLQAAIEVLKAAPPKHNLLFSRRTRCGPVVY